MKKTGTPTRKTPAQGKKSALTLVEASPKKRKAVKPKKAADLPLPDDEESQVKPENAFPIIGLGASAGGLEAFEIFFKNMPEDNGMAFVLISHLDPAHTSMMKELMSKYTKMEVLQVEDGMKLEPNKVFVIPPNRYMSAFDNTLQLSEPEDPRGLRMPIDFFLRSLAADEGERAICVIMSGTGSDGTLGLRAIHGSGGISVVQDPATAKYSGMPQSAIDTGLADYILPPEKMPAQLISYIQHTYPRRKKQDDIYRQRAGTTLQKILNLIKQQTGHDFSFYKKNTINRRIERRMNVLEIEDDAAYLRFLQEHPEEVKLLFKEMLINVTSFFRDKEAFQGLKEKILPELLMTRPPGYSLRVWVPGCATGEEVYSLCIVLREVMDSVNRDFKMQIFGTDIDEDSIAYARAGLYPSNIAIDVSPERLKKYFVKDDNGFRVKKEIRESVVFAVQNVIKDAPFTKMDLISCRNLLIYMDSQLQNKVLPLFHFSLLPGGVLFLGSSESIGGFIDLFSTADKKWKVFRRRESASAVQSTLLQGLPWTFEPHRERRDKSTTMQEVNIPDIVRKYLLDHYTPSSVIIDEKGEIVYINGRTGNYLEPAPGKANLNIFDMTREGLRMELRTAVHQARSFSREVKYTDLRVKTNGEYKLMNLTVKPLTDVERMAGLLMVVVEETGDAKKNKSKAEKTSKETKDVTELQEELRYTRSSLQATIEEAQASNEELKSANEELQSTNEELQSTNEELETSKEELQSINEELITVNSELQAKIEQLSRTESDLKYLLDSTNIGIIFLEDDLRIKRFTREVTKYINLIPSDLGRPLSDIAINLDIDLVGESKKVIRNLAFKELEVKTKEGQWLLVRIMPFRNTENVFDGLVLTFTDINVMKQEQVLLGEFGDVSLLLDNVPQGFVLSGPDGKIKFINRHGRELLGRFESAPASMTKSDQVEFWRFYRDGGRKPPYEELPLTRVVRRGEEIKDEKWHIRRDGKDIPVSCDGRPIRDNKGKIIGGILTFKEQS